MSHYNPFIASWTQSPPGSATNPHNFPKCCILHSDLWFSWQIRKKKGGRKKCRKAASPCNRARADAERWWTAAIPTQTHPVVLLLHLPSDAVTEPWGQGWASGGGRNWRGFNASRPIAGGECWRGKPLLCWSRLQFCAWSAWKRVELVLLRTFPGEKLIVSRQVLWNHDAEYLGRWQPRAGALAVPCR